MTSSPFDLRGTTVVITGAGSGLGAAYAHALAHAGAELALIDVDPAGLASTEADLRHSGHAPLVFDGDVTDRSRMDEVIVDCLQQMGRIDVLINNAGIGDAKAKPLAEMDLDEWRRVLAVNLDGVAICSQAVLGPMKQAGSGKIINIASIHAFRAAASIFPLPAYSASKGAVVSLTRELAVECGPDGITVNALCPGFVRTAIAGNGYDSQAFCDRLSSLNPLGRIAEPDEFHGAIVFLASSASDYMTGQTLIIDGGYSVR